jgi:hypothetical protein
MVNRLIWHQALRFPPVISQAKAPDPCQDSTPVLKIDPGASWSILAGSWQSWSALALHAEFALDAGVSPGRGVVVACRRYEPTLPAV